MPIITIFQFSIALVALVFFLSALAKFIRRERTQTLFKFFANSIVWLSIMLFVLFPKLTHLVSQKLGFGESLNTLIFIGFIIVFMILFKLINIIEKTERHISEIIRKEALTSLEKND